MDGLFKASSHPSVKALKTGGEELATTLQKEPLNVENMLQLGRQYVHGIGVRQDNKEAIRLFSAAYSLGSHATATEHEKQAAVNAALHLSELYADDGKFADSLNWLKKANTGSNDIVDPDNHAKFEMIEKARELANKFSHVEEGLLQKAEDKPVIMYLLFARNLLFSIISGQSDHWKTVFANISYQLGDLYVTCRLLNRNEVESATHFDFSVMWGNQEAKERYSSYARRGIYGAAFPVEQTLTVAISRGEISTGRGLMPDERNKEL